MGFGSPAAGMQLIPTHGMDAAREADLVRALELRPVGPAVGNVRNDSADLVAAVAAEVAAAPRSQ